jgi:hypothetical protein
MSYPAVLAAIHQIENAAELRGILAFLGQTKSTTTYVPLASALGMFSGGSALASMLGDLQIEDAKRSEPFTSSLVLGAKTGIPGNGYFTHARKLGCSINKDPVSEFLFWAGQMNLLGCELPDTSRNLAKQLGITDAQIDAA